MARKSEMQQQAGKSSNSLATLALTYSLTGNKSVLGKKSRNCITILDM